MNKLIKATILITGVSSLGKLLGFLREVAYAKYFGATSLMDAFVVANMIPITFGGILQIGMITAFIPIYSQYVSQNRINDARNLINTLITTLVLILTAICSISFLSAETIIKIISPGFNQETVSMAASLFQILLPIVVMSALLGVFSAVQQAEEEFFFPPFAGLVYNFSVIAFLVAFHSYFDIQAIAMAVSLGVLLQVMIQWIGLRRIGIRLKFNIDIKNEGVIRVFSLAIPLGLWASVDYLNLFTVRILASSLPEGSISALSYANGLNTATVAMLIIPFLTVLYPRLSTLYFSGDEKKYLNTLSLAIRMILFIMIPLMAYLILFSKPIIQILFERGAFTPQATALTVTALQFFTLGLLGTGIIELLNRAFYAQQDTKTPVIVSFIIVSVNLCMGIILINYLSHGGLALANSIANSIGMLILVIILKRRMIFLEKRQIAVSMIKVIVACFFMVGFSGLMFQYLENVMLALGLPLRLSIASLVGAGTYIAVSYLVKSAELKYFQGMIIRVFNNYGYFR
ncbi:MAG: murein biosynthesis integral membrane protein MurJ [Negativicutes bacterium]|nr:murein biosynthesis integral membrane protein MurJ [Negativicutes bacterium]